jgi:hypothetical protein
MGFGHVQGNQTVTASGLTNTVTWPSTPTPGNLLILAGLAGSRTSTPIISIADANSNVYYLTPKSPFNISGVGLIFVAWTVAPANASATVTITYNTANNGNIFLEEFTPSGNVLFDLDVIGNVTNTGTTCNGVSITPSNINELLYGVCSPSNGTITAPGPGATLGVWTGGAGNSVAGGTCYVEYDLAATGSTACNWTDSFANDQCLVFMAAWNIAFKQVFDDGGWLP